MNSLAVVNASDGGVETETAVVEKPPKTLRRLQVFSGYPTPSGATTKDGGVNFAICSSNATSASLCLINLSDLPEVRPSPSFSQHWSHPPFLGMTKP
ncbi:unnamed protein product [Ilex paraguariensis]|uniref:Uncharacterized protein n=1 Tax=Ilex paraguariensis TaxID=185542 RepID=A0ABC8R3V2_9AQUA